MPTYNYTIPNNKRELKPFALVFSTLSHYTIPNNKRELKHNSLYFVT